MQFVDKQENIVIYQMTLWTDEKEIKLVSYNSETKPEETFNSLLGEWIEIDHENLDAVDLNAVKFAGNHLMEKMKMKLKEF